ncbi:phosphatidylinositol-glycan biosynthesis class S protein [Xylariomycetidae sp. FL2044]|nr:phosphatidylinositol-glycan biosynthesis class S protein [Xylariomycetidae sp. FL2044]
MASTSDSRQDNKSTSEAIPVAVVDPGSHNETGTKTDSAQPSKRKQPPPEKPTDIRRRSFVIASFWLLVLSLGLPIWWNTTTIHRANLPLSQMLDWANGKVCLPVVPIRVAVDAPGLEVAQVQDLMRLTKHALGNYEGIRIPVELALAPATRESKSDIVSSSRDDEVALTVRLNPGDAALATLDSHSSMLHVSYPPGSLPSTNSPTSGLATYLASQIHTIFSEEQAIMNYMLATSSVSSEHQSQAASHEVSESLSKRMTRSLKHSRTYHLTFSLFTSGPTPNSWEIETAVDRYMRPVLDMLDPIHNFTIDTQVQLYAAPGVSSQVLNKEELSSFINAAEWPLSPSIGGAPTVNFVVYTGNQTIGMDSDTATSRSWLIPQWGSVYLLSPPPDSRVPFESLKQPMMIFTSHLLSLLGTPQSGSLPMQLSTLTRVRSADLILRASSSLGSLARLAVALPSMSIPSNVADGVTESMHHLELACQNLGGMKGLQHARIAEAEAERAFFEKSMVGQLYFPDEHKVAVYLPLLGPVGVPLVMGLLNEIKAWRKRRSEKLKTS